MNKTLTLNLFGGPSTGKSTTAAGVFTLLKLHGVNCELVTEFAKDLTWECRTKTLLNQRYIFGKQYHRQWRVSNGVDIIITDSPLLLNLCYNNYSLSKEFIADVLNVWSEFDNQNFMLERTKPYNFMGRTQNEEEAKQIDKAIEAMLNKYEIKYEPTYGTTSSVINTISSIILVEFFNEDLKIRFIGNK